MYQEIVPLKPLGLYLFINTKNLINLIMVVDNNPDGQYKIWLREIYEETFVKILGCIENGKLNIKLQALSTAMKLICWEGKYPLEPKNSDYYFPTQRLKVYLIFFC